MISGEFRRRLLAMTPYRPVLLLTFLPLAACVSVTTLEGRELRMASPEFRAYVESVFREQNRVATELTFALESARPETPDYAALDTAESALLDACAGLNEIATRRRDGEDRKRLRDAGAARRAPACEGATRDAAATLAALGERSSDGD